MRSFEESSGGFSGAVAVSEGAVEGIVEAGEGSRWFGVVEAIVGDVVSPTSVTQTAECISVRSGCKRQM